MSRIKLIIYLSACMLLMVSCRGKDFTIDIDLPADVNRTYMLVYYASDDSRGRLTEAVVNVQKGKGQIKCVTINPTLVYVMTDFGTAPKAIFYAKRGNNIKITGTDADPANWNITGNKMTDELTAFRLSHKPVKEYIKENPENPVSTILLLTFFDRRNDEKGFAECWKMLKGKASEGKWQELVANADMTGIYDPDMKLPSQIVLNTAETGCDTIAIGRVPALLYFSAPSEREEARANKRALRDISRELSDSSKRVIADISFDPDSSAYRYSIRRDSLNKALHAWMPLGLSDSVAHRLGVTRIPYVIVVDKKGKVAYRGDQLPAAVQAFRKTVK